MARGVSFKLSKTTKMVAAGIVDTRERREYIALMIAAQKASDNFRVARVRTRDAATPAASSSPE